jgi:hypothetical protein
MDVCPHVYRIGVVQVLRWADLQSKKSYKMYVRLTVLLAISELELVNGPKP